MNPHFADFASFLAMGGYAFYVWTSFALTAVVLGGVMLQPLWQQRRLMRREQRQRRR